MLRGPTESSWRVAAGIFACHRRHRPSFHREALVFTEGEREETSREEFIWSVGEIWYLLLIILKFNPQSRKILFLEKRIRFSWKQLTISCRQARRPVMDLPTTDPGSDLCDLTDSADESFVRSEGREYDGIHPTIYQNKYVYRHMSYHVCVSCSCMEKYAGISWRDNRALREGDVRERGTTGKDADFTGNRETSQRVFRRVTSKQGSPEDSPTTAMPSVRVNYFSNKKTDKKNSSIAGKSNTCKIILFLLLQVFRTLEINRDIKLWAHIVEVTNVNHFI